MDMTSVFLPVINKLAANLVASATGVILAIVPFWCLFLLGRKLGFWDKNYKEERAIRREGLADFKEFQRQYKHHDWGDWRDYKMWKHGFTSEDFRRDSTARIVAREEFRRYKRWQKGQNVKFYVRPLNSSSSVYKDLRKADRDFRSRRWVKRS